MTASTSKGEDVALKLPEDFTQRTQDITALEMWASKNGLHYFARALNNAKNTLGWEASGNTKMAILAMHGKRAGEP